MKMLERFLRQVKSVSRKNQNMQQGSLEDAWQGRKGAQTFRIFLSLANYYQKQLHLYSYHNVAAEYHRVVANVLVLCHDS